MSSIYLIDKKVRKNTANLESHKLNKILYCTFKGLWKSKYITTFKQISESFCVNHFTVHTTYECTFHVNEIAHIVQFHFSLDIRNIALTAIEETRTCSNQSKVALRSDFNQSELYKMLCKRIWQWRYGIENEEVFMTFMQEELVTQNNRIVKAYKTGNRQDGKTGVDYVVSFLTKPYYELAEVKFQLKSSFYFLDRHKDRHPKISVFVFKYEVDLKNAANKAAAKRRFQRFLIKASQSNTPIYM